MEFAEQLTKKDPLRAHADAELQIDPDNLTSPWHAAWASLLAFTVGGLIPLLAIAFPPTSARVWTCGAPVAVGLLLAGLVFPRLGNAQVPRASGRNVGAGPPTMVLTFHIRERIA